jgi:3-methylcrotonyl-CoA carboxylase alpha subunit/acetyl-CoA/propionyl-CoA carboxylase biotin carboxyl carrier protein
VTASGHAIEARVYAEDPANGFLPQAGRASFVRWSPRARVDAALESGQEVGTTYDPMLGKVIAHGATREAARRALVAALDDTAIFGVTTNLGFVRDLVASDAFRAAAIDTGWLDRTPDAAGPDRDDGDLARAAAAWAAAAASADGVPGDPFAAGDGWRVGGPAAPVAVDLEGPGGRVVVRVDRAAGILDDGGRPRAVREIGSDDESHLQLEVDGERHDFFVERAAHAITVGHRGRAHVFRREPFLHDATAAAADGAVAAPMPGTILAVPGAEGATVAAGETVVVLEAMKMEIALQAPFDGTVAELDAAEGQQVPLGRTLFRVVATGDAPE